MSSMFAKPDTALRKAKDLVRVNKHSSALKTLHNILISKRFRLWQATHEKIMYFYLELAVDLRRNVKDALIQYRTICASTNTVSLDRVLRYYQKLASDKATTAEAAAAKAGVTLNTEESSASGENTIGVTTDNPDSSNVVHLVSGVIVGVDGDDEEVDQSPESLLMMARSGEGSKQRKDRQILLPWVRYLWECYRTILDVLRNNARLEKLYHEIARSSFAFCLKYQRRQEFRKVGELMRNHLFNMNKYANQNNAVDLNSPDTQASYLETRFQQLKTAADMELWQEAYRTIEDIYENMRQSHSDPSALLMQTYYDKLSQIFWAASNYLFHAYSLNKYFTLSLSVGDNNNRMSIANAVVLSALIVSSGSLEEEGGGFSARHEGNARLAQLLGFKKETPSRTKLLSLLISQGVLTLCSEDVTAIYDLIEHSFTPLTLTQQLTPLFAKLESDPILKRYVIPLQQLTIIRVLQQLSTVFKSMRIEQFLTLIPPIFPSVAPLTSILPIERLIMAAISSDQISLQIDSQHSLLLFPEEDFEGQKMKDQLMHLSRSLSQLADQLEPVKVNEKLRERQHVFALIASGVNNETEAVYQRQLEIEKRKQEQERLALEKERKEHEAKEKQTKERKAEETRRLEEESRRRETERQKKEKEERDLAAKQALAQEISKKVETVVGSGKGLASKAAKKMRELTQDLEKIDRAALLAAQEAVLDQERREQERRRRETMRRNDYFTRAYRLEERELLLSLQEKQRIEEKEQIARDYAKYVDEHKKLHEKGLTERERLRRMKEEKDKFIEKMLERRHEQKEIEIGKQAERFLIRLKEVQREERRRKEEEDAKEKERQRLAAMEAERLEREAAKLRAAEEEKKKKEEERLKKEQERLDIIAKEREREERLERNARERRERAEAEREKERQERDRERERMFGEKRKETIVNPNNPNFNQVKRDEGPFRRNFDERGSGSASVGDKDRGWRDEKINSTATATATSGPISGASTASQQQQRNEAAEWRRGEVTTTSSPSPTVSAEWRKGDGGITDAEDPSNAINTETTSPTVTLSGSMISNSGNNSSREDKEWRRGSAPSPPPKEEGRNPWRRDGNQTINARSNYSNSGNNINEEININDNRDIDNDRINEPMQDINNRRFPQSDRRSDGRNNKLSDRERDRDRDRDRGDFRRPPPSSTDERNQQSSSFSSSTSNDRFSSLGEGRRNDRENNRDLQDRSGDRDRDRDRRAGSGNSSNTSYQNDDREYRRDNSGVGNNASKILNSSRDREREREREVGGGINSMNRGDFNRRSTEDDDRRRSSNFRQDRSGDQRDKESTNKEN